MVHFNKQSPITSRFRMLKELIQCKSEGHVVALWSEKLQNSLHLCVVKEIRMDEDENEVLVFFRDAKSGVPRADEFTLFLSEIDQINTFHRNFPRVTES